MNELVLILGMFAVTYGPRLAPFYLLREPPRGWISRFLGALPVAAMAALIFPDVFTAVDGDLVPATIGLVVAAIAGWFVRGLILPLVASVGAVTVYLLLQSGIG
jgi:branched-subunit amino acid transport protein